MLATRRIAILVERNAPYSRAVLRGIVKYARPTRPWLFHTWSIDSEWTKHDTATLRAWQPMGVLVQNVGGFDVNIAHQLCAMKTPTVDLSLFPTMANLPHVGIDHFAVGKMIGEEFHAQGLHHAAYVGWRDPASEHQYNGLRDGFGRHGVNALFRIDIATLPSSKQVDHLAKADFMLAEWLKKLPKPLGLMLHDDTTAAWLTQPCLTAGLRVPEDVSIIGVYDDETNCQFAYPAVSSVEVPGERVGYEAARLLDQLMEDNQRGAKKPAGVGKLPRILLPPVGVVRRQSSDLVAIDDPDVATAVRFIRQNAHRPVRVSEVFENAAVGSRRMQQRFKQALGRTPAAEIQRVHLDRAAQLLAQTNLPLRTIAQRSGFSDMHHLAHTFRRLHGKTPNQYRRQFSLGFAPTSTD